MKTYFVALLASQTEQVALVSGEHIGELHQYVKTNNLRILQVIENLSQERAEQEVITITSMMFPAKISRALH